MKLAVVGTGYVGLVSGTCFAEIGNDVTCVDIDADKVERMKQGHVPIYEPGLEELFKRNIEEKRLSFTTDLAAAVHDADIIFLALPTPPNEDGSADLSYILNVAHTIGSLLGAYAIVVNKSTVPVGTAEKVSEAIAANATGKFDVVSNPEFLREGHAIADFMKADRIVIGTQSTAARERMGELYQTFVEQGSHLYFMDERSAEMTKYAANAFLATKITFMNEMANLCELTGANIDEVRLGIGSDGRIGSRFLFPGIGYGGSCFPKDVQALRKTAQDNKYQFKILDAVTDVNETQKHILFDKIKTHYNGDIAGKRFALWGLAFKAQTDDIRESPALYLLDDLLAAGASVVAFDPEAGNNVRTKYANQERLEIVHNEYEALQAADALLVATEWSSFKNPDWSRVLSSLNAPVVFDGRNIYDPAHMKTRGIHYVSIGRGTPSLMS